MGKWVCLGPVSCLRLRFRLLYRTTMRWTFMNPYNRPFRKPLFLSIRRNLQAKFILPVVPYFLHLGRTAFSQRCWDSAKTLSVLGNMGGVVDDCGLRFVQIRRRPPQNTPDFGGPKINFEKSRACNHTKSMN